MSNQLDNIIIAPRGAGTAPPVMPSVLDRDRGILHELDISGILAYLFEVRIIAYLLRVAIAILHGTPEIAHGILRAADGGIGFGHVKIKLRIRPSRMDCCSQCRLLNRNFRIDSQGGAVLFHGLIELLQMIVGRAEVHMESRTVTL